MQSLTSLTKCSVSISKRPSRCLLFQSSPRLLSSPLFRQWPYQGCFHLPECRTSTWAFHLLLLLWGRREADRNQTFFPRLVPFQQGGPSPLRSVSPVLSGLAVIYLVAAHTSLPFLRLLQERIPTFPLGPLLSSGCSRPPFLPPNRASSGFPK